jgi:hypothetical protein
MGDLSRCLSSSSSTSHLMLTNGSSAPGAASAAARAISTNQAPGGALKVRFLLDVFLSTEANIVPCCRAMENRYSEAA